MTAMDFDKGSQLHYSVVVFACVVCVFVWRGDEQGGGLEAKSMLFGQI